MKKQIIKVFKIIGSSLLFIVWLFSAVVIYNFFYKVNFSAIIAACICILLYLGILKIYAQTQQLNLLISSLNLTIFVIILFSCFYFSFQNSLSCHPFLRKKSLMKLAGKCHEITKYNEYIIQFLTCIYVYLSSLLFLFFTNKGQRKTQEISKSKKIFFIVIWNLLIGLALIAYNPKVFCIFFLLNKMEVF